MDSEQTSGWLSKEIMSESYKYKAMVFWTKEKLENFPVSGEYITTSSISENGVDRWSIKLTFDPPIQPANEPWSGFVEFLASDGPWHILHPEMKFELLEGKRVSATVKIIENGL